MLPNFLIIGAQRSGTTWLYENLVKHPEIIPASTKEVHFFDNNFSRGLEWYKSHFTHTKNSQINNHSKSITGEASPYYIFHPLAPERISNIIPSVKIIILLRNPVDRAFTHYHHEVILRAEKSTFEEAISSEPTRLEGEEEKIINNKNYYSFNHQHFSYLSRGIYISQLERWMNLFPTKQILIIKSEDFFSEPQLTIENVFNFLNVPLIKIDFNKPNIFNHDKMGSSTKEYLEEYFKPHNQSLYKFLNRDFSW